jgi:Arc/MetJ-type ribon-helix-helix transcriptional regulator
MIQNRIVCFRLDEQIDHRISLVLGSRFSTRSRFIRTAIEHLLLREEGQVRLRAAQMKIDWGWFDRSRFSTTPIADQHRVAMALLRQQDGIAAVVIMMEPRAACRIFLCGWVVSDFYSPALRPWRCSEQ